MTDLECKTLVPSKTRTVSGSLQLDAYYYSGGFNKGDTHSATNGGGDSIPPILNEQGIHKTENVQQKEIKSSREWNRSPSITTKEAPGIINECPLMSELSFFTDPSYNAINEGQESADLSLNCINKYFSTPMPSNGKAKKKLSPIIEVESEASALPEMQSENKKTITDMRKCPRGLDAHLSESPTHSPLYRSFFANEWQEIVKQIEGSESDLRKTPAKRKAEELEVSSIAAEPLPYDCTPMKSMLACEVAHMISSLENSPVKDASTFGESLLDLDKTDMQFQDFDLSACDIRSSKIASLNDSSLKVFLEDKQDCVSSTKRQKMVSLSCVKAKEIDVESVHSSVASHEVHCPFDKSKWSISAAANVQTVSQALGSSQDDVVLSANNTWLHPANTLDIDFSAHEVSNNAIERTEVIPPTLGNILQDNVLNEGVSIASTAEIIEAASPSPNIPNRVSVHGETNRAENITWVMDITSETCSAIKKKIGPSNTSMVIGMVQRSANTTQDIVATHTDLCASNTTQVMGVVSQSAQITQDNISAQDSTQIMGVVPLSADTTQDVPILEEVVPTNTTQVMGVAAQSADTTQEIVPTKEDIGATNTSQVMGAMLPSMDSTQDLVPTQEEVGAANITQVISVLPLSGDTTQDIEPTEEEVGAANITQVMGVIATSADITQDIVLTQEEKGAANITQVMGVMPSSVDTTQDIVPTQEEVGAANFTQVMGVMPSSVDTTQDIVPTQEEVGAANFTQVMGVIPSSGDTTQDIVPTQEEVGAANFTQVMGVMPSSVDTTQDIVPTQEEVGAANFIQVMGVIPSTGDTTQDIVPKQEGVGTASFIQVMGVIQPAADTTDIVATEEEVGTANTTQVMGVVPSTADTTQDIAPTQEAVCAANTTQVMTVVPPATDTTQDIVPTQEQVGAANITQDGVVPLSADTTQEIIPQQRKVGEANTTQVMSVLPQLVDNAQDMVLPNEVHSASTLAYKEKVIKQVSEDSKHEQQKLDIHPKADVAPFNTDTVTAEQSLTLSSTMPPVVLKPFSSPHSSFSLATNAIRTMQVSEEVQDKIPSMNTDPDIQAPESAANSITEHNNISAKEVHHNSDYSPNPAKEIVLLEKTEVQASKTPLAYHATVDCLSSQNKSDVAQKSTSGTNDGNANTCAAIGSTHCEVCPSRKPAGHFLMSESCSIIQEEENVHDVSVFSVGSLSFVTSTPVPGVTNFQFQKACRESEHQDHNESVGCVGGEPQRKISLDQSVTTQPGQGMPGASEENQKKTKVSMLPTTKRTMLPPQASSISFARRSLALQNSSTQASAKETIISKISPKGIPGRGIRPPMTRQSLSRASLGNSKPVVEGSAGILLSNKPVSRFRAPKTATEKARPISTSSQLPHTSSVKPPSQVNATNIGRPSLGVHNTTTRLQEASCGETSVVRPGGARTGILKPGRLSLRPPLPSTAQKTSPKSSTLKSHLPGLPVKKREISTLGPHKEMGSLKGECTASRKTLKPTQSIAMPNNKTCSFKAAGKPNAFTQQIEQAAVEIMENCKIPVEEVTSLPTKSTEAEDCCHLETCKCCHTRYLHLLKEIDDLKLQLGQVRHGQMAMSKIAEHTVKN